MSHPPGPRGGTTPAWYWSVPALLLLVPALGWPLVILATFAADREAISAVLLGPALWQRLGASTAQALISAAVSVLLGLPVACVLTRFRFRGAGTLHFLATLPLVLPTVVLALAVRELLGPAGWVNGALERLGRAPIEVAALPSIVAAHAIFGVAIVVWLVGDASARLDPRQIEAARMLGAGPRRAFRHVALPVLAPAAAAAAILVFLFAFTSFGVVLLLGAPGLETLEVTIYRLATRPDLWPAAAVIALLQLVPAVAALTTRATLRPHNRPPRVPGLARRPVSASERVTVALAAALVLLLVAVPLAGVVAGAFALDGAFSTRHFEALLTASPGAIAAIETVFWSLAFAAGATVLALIAGGAAAYAISHASGGKGVALAALVRSPLAMPPVALGFAYTVTANNTLVDLRGSPLLVLAAHAVITYPFVLRAVLPAARALDPRLSEAARLLGATPRSAWRRVTLPVLRRSLIAGGAFAFAISFGELGATLLLRRPAFTTAPVAVFDALTRPGSGTGVALALSTVLVAVAVVAFLIAGRARRAAEEG